MRVFACLLIAVCSVVAPALAGAMMPELWAIDAGPQWAQNDSYIIQTDPFASISVGHPVDSLEIVFDAAYVPSLGMLYLAGNGPDDEAWYESTIALYSGAPGSMTEVSYSNAGMDGFNWAAGIEYLDGSIYAIGLTQVSSGDVFLIRIDNPGTASQTVTQIGDYLGNMDDIGVPFALTSGPNGMLIGGLGANGGSSGTANLFRIDPTTGDAQLLHAYGDDDLDSSVFEGLAYSSGVLYGLTTNGTLYEIDVESYGVTELATMGDQVWTALVAVPEPGTILLMLGGVVALVMRRKRK